MMMKFTWMVYAIGAIVHAKYYLNILIRRRARAKYVSVTDGIRKLQFPGVVLHSFNFL